MFSATQFRKIFRLKFSRSYILIVNDIFVVYIRHCKWINPVIQRCHDFTNTSYIKNYFRLVSRVQGCLAIVVYVVGVWKRPTFFVKRNDWAKFFKYFGCLHWIRSANAGTDHAVLHDHMTSLSASSSLRLSPIMTNCYSFRAKSFGRTLMLFWINEIRETWRLCIRKMVPV